MILRVSATSEVFQRDGFKPCAKAMPGNDKINILLVDDLPEKLLVLETILEDLGENLVKAHSGEEALRHVLQDEFAVILLDVNMPGMDGYETAAYIRRRKKSAHTPIIFITAYADEMHTSAGYSLGAVDYIFTPVVPEILRTKVKVFADLFRMTELVRRQADERVALAREQAARAAAEEATRRSTFLAQAGNILSSSLDVHATLQALARLVVPFLADVSIVAIAEDNGRAGHFEVAWTGAAGEIRTHHLPRITALPEGLSTAIEQTLQSGKTTIPEVLGTWPGAPATTAEKNGQHWPPTEVVPQTAMVLPLRARGRTLGTLALALQDRRHGAAELALALDLVGRAAIALDNARLYQNIQEADRRKNEFLVMLAHELRNPLAPIRNAVQVLRLLAPSEPVLLEARNMIDRQVTHMARLIDDLLDMSRLARGKILLRMQPVDLVELLRATTEDYRRVFEASGLTLTVAVPDQPVFVSGDPTRLAQIVGNILHNANKFTDAGGQVLVQVTSERDSVRIVIRDSGIGMEPAMLARVFETFSQADNSLDRSRGGLGLGLALVKGLVELHGGRVTACSDGLGTGTEVNIWLPLQRQPVKNLEPTERQRAPRRTQRILIIEDNHDAADSLRTLFQLTGHEVEVAYAGPAGIDAARRFQPEVVLCDIGLPGGMDGYAVAQTLRGEPALAHIHLIALTGYGQEQDQRRSLEAGFHAHLTKPVDFPDLERLLTDLKHPEA